MAAKPDAWMPLYFGAYLTDTMHLTTEQHGAYLLMLMAAWKLGGSLPDDDVQIASIARLPVSRWRRARPIIEPFWKISGGRWSQKRLGAELDKARQYVESQSEKGKKGGRGNKAGEKLDVKPDESRGKAGAKPTETPLPSPTPRSRTRSNPLSADADGEFEKFWSTYPRKTAKQAALKAFRKINPDADLLAFILKSIAAHTQTEQWRRDVIPHAATWLNHRRWEDELGRAARPKDTSCQRFLNGTKEPCGMPGKPHPVYGYSCEHCDRREAEARGQHEMPPAVRDKLRDAGVLR